MQASTEKPSASLASRLEKIPSEDPLFKTVVEELLKVFYASEEWNRFFAYARYYREKWKASERSETQLLEGLALLRHCQNEQLFRWIAFQKSQSPAHIDRLNQMEALAHTTFAGKSAQPAQTHETTLHFEGKTLWKSDHSHTKEIHPKNVRIHVESLCSAR